MKRVVVVIALMALTISSACLAQRNNKHERLDVDLLGVDFSGVNVVGAKETADKFINAFEGINGLLLTEPDKYDVGKFLNFNILSTNTDDAAAQIAKLEGTKFQNKQKKGIDIEQIIANYPSSEGLKLLIIAKELNKPQNRGTFVAVVFDGQTKDILMENEFTGKAGGFGLRNFWAGALHDGMKKYYRGY